MPRDKIFYVACFGLALGVLLRSFYRVDSAAIFFIGLGYVLLMLFCSAVLRKNWDTVISVFVLALLCGILRFQLADVPPPSAFEAQVGQRISVSGMVADDPVKSASDIKLTLEAPSGKGTVGIVLFVKRDEGYRYGDEADVTGTLEKPTNFMTDQGLEFDYVNYLRKDGIFYTMRNPDIVIRSSGHGSAIKRALFSAKAQFETAIAKAIPAPESDVLDGIILGQRSAFSPSLRQAFTDTGTIHIVTVGGYHVTLVAQWIMSLLGFLPRYAGIGAGIFSVLLYIIATGGSAATIRAGIMAILALLAEVSGRRYAGGRALVFAAALMILANPFILAYDVSFELSFMAAIAIIFFSPRINPYVQWVPWKWLRDIAAITCSMYVFTLPFVLYRMGRLSLVALPANILIVPLMPATMIAGFVTGFAGLVSPALALIPGKITYLLLDYQISVIRGLAGLPFAAVTIPNFPLALIVLVYAIFFWIFVTGYGGEETPEEAPSDERVPARPRLRLLVLLLPLVITLCASAYLSYRHFASNQMAAQQLQKVLVAAANAEPAGTFVPNQNSKSSGCNVQGRLPDQACTPGAIFEGAAVEQICVPGYSKSVRNVSANLRKKVYAEYGMRYPAQTGTYEVDHLIPLALGGSNDIANLWPEAAAPAPGFHEKDVVEVFLQREVCAGRAALPAAQRQISTDWLAVFNSMTFEEIRAITDKYGMGANQ